MMSIPSMLMRATLLVAVLTSSASCGIQSNAQLYDGDQPRELPRVVVVDLGPYANVDEALADIEVIDWDRDPERARSVTLAYAAAELRNHLAALGFDMEVRSAATGLPTPSIVLAVLDEECGTFATIGRGDPFPGQDCRVLGEQGYAISPVRGRIWITANSRTGVLYGVYGLLEELGFSWDDPWETILPDHTDVETWDWRRIVRVPRIELRGFWIYGPQRTPDEFATWMARNRLNVGGLPTAPMQRLLGIRGWAGEHNLLQEEFSVSGLFEEHPEWYAEINGLRQPIPPSGLYFNPSFANREAAEYFAARLVQRLETGDLRGVDVLNVWPADDRFNRFDQSDAARALGNETDNLLNFYLNVARELRVAFDQGRLSRRVTLAGISYFLTMNPPTNEAVVEALRKENYLHLFYPIERDWNGPVDQDLPDRESNRKLLAAMTAWQETPFEQGVVDYHNHSLFAGIAITDHLSQSENQSVFARDRRGLYAYMHPILRNPGPRRLTNILLAKLSWGGPGEVVEADAGTAEQIRAAYFRRRYGAQAEEWHRVYDLICQSSENAKEMFTFNSLTWLLLQEQIWGDRFYGLDETIALIRRYESGGVQDLPAAFSNARLERARFRGLDESLVLLSEARSRWESVLKLDLDPATRLRMQSDVEWFVTTESRYKLIDATIDLVRARAAGHDDSDARARITEELNRLRTSPLTADTISPIDQRAFLDLYSKLAGQ